MEPHAYDRFPTVAAPAGLAGQCWADWPAVEDALRRAVEARLLREGSRRLVLAVECYPGVLDDDLRARLAAALRPALTLDAKAAFLSPAGVDALVAPFLGGDDPLFGRLCPLELEAFLDPDRVRALQAQAGRVAAGLVLVVGPAAALLAPDAGLLVYADLPRWEGQLRQRRGEVPNLGADNRGHKASLQYKRSFFIDWRVCDRLKQRTLARWDFLLDTTRPAAPRLLAGAAHLAALRHAATRPLRLQPFFDPGPWGGRWMQRVCGLDPAAANYAWCFDGVPEENSLVLDFAGRAVEVPALNLVFREPEALLGRPVHARFGAEFPIRFDLLDTMGGGNLSFQVHPTAAFARAHFGLAYTQEESYYLLDAEPGGAVLLGRADGADFEAMMAALQAARDGGEPFDAGRFAAVWPARRHDHFLIPPGTVHCSGAGTMVLEISATPYIFTFKLWDWGRLGLDGLPRPVNLARGREVIDWSRDAAFARAHLVNRVRPAGSGPGWRAEETGLPPESFIRVRRHWFTGRAPHDTGGAERGGVHVLNLVQGAAAVVESPGGAFEPFTVRYAETFIVPAAVGAYTVRPHEGQPGAELATVQASVRE